MRRIFLFAVLLALILFIVIFFPGLDLASIIPGHNDTSEELPAPDPDDQKKPEIQTATLVAVGDILGHKIQVDQARVELGDGSITYDFSPSYEFIAPYLQEADLAVGNLETTFAGEERGGYRFTPGKGFNTPEELAQNLKEAGFDLLATANNHSLDSDMWVAEPVGLKNTIAHIEAAGMRNFGTYASQEARDTPLIADVNGIKIAFIAYTETTNMVPVPPGHDYCINFIPGFDDITPIVNDIEAARRDGADIVALYLHWGKTEYVFEPEERQREMARRLAEAGADLILGGHVHVIQPLEWITVTGGERAGRQVLVAYSMGNFISNQHYSPGAPNYIPTGHTKAGLMVEVEFQKNMDSGVTVIVDAGYRITWVHRNWRHRILPTDEVVAQGPERYKLNEADYAKLLDSHTKMKEIVEAYAFSDGKP